MNTQNQVRHSHTLRNILHMQIKQQISVLTAWIKIAQGVMGNKREILDQTGRVTDDFPEDLVLHFER